MRSFAILICFTACGTAAVSTTASDTSVGGRDSNPPLSLLSPAKSTAKGHSVTGHTTVSAGARDYTLYIPSGAAANWPLVVMLHGCAETPASFAGGTRMNALADASHFYVLYPRKILRRMRPAAGTGSTRPIKRAMVSL